MQRYIDGEDRGYVRVELDERVLLIGGILGEGEKKVKGRIEPIEGGLEGVGVL